MKTFEINARGWVGDFLERYQVLDARFKQFEQAILELDIT